MKLSFHPQPGTILICDFDTGFRAPEMVKSRPVVVLSPRLRRRDGLCTVVPLSTTPPAEVQAYHHRLVLERPLPSPWDSPEMWVKVDMLSTVGFGRLSLIRVGKGRDGKRKYIQPMIPAADIDAIRACARLALGL